MSKRSRRAEDEATEVIAALTGEDTPGSWAFSVTERQAWQAGQVTRALEYLEVTAYVAMPAGDRLEEVLTQAAAILRATPEDPFVTALAGIPG